MPTISDIITSVQPVRISYPEYVEYGPWKQF